MDIADLYTIWMIYVCIYFIYISAVETVFKSQVSRKRHTGIMMVAGRTRV